MVMVCVVRACYGVLRFIMESGAKGCEVVVSGKLRGQRAKSMKFVDGLMIHSGEPTNDYVDTAVRHVLLRQGQYACSVQQHQCWAHLFSSQLLYQNCCYFQGLVVNCEKMLCMTTSLAVFVSINNVILKW